MKPQEPYILALDQGTTSCRAIVFDRNGRTVRSAQREFTQYFPKPGWVEHDAAEIWDVQLQVMRQAAEGLEDKLAAVGITNQRETAVVWDRTTGKPLHPAIVWQCRRTAELCRELKEQGFEPAVRDKTGLLLDPYFSGTKLKWLLDSHPDIRRKAEAGEALFGTIDTWLIWNLTGGQIHATDPSNASRTMLYNIHTLEWDHDLLQALGIPHRMLPEVKPSSGLFGHTRLLGGAPLPVSGAAGDQQAALFGQQCTEAGMVKNTYGTGCFLLKQTGNRPVRSDKGLLTTIAWQAAGRTCYALEGSVFSAGSVVQWLRDGLGLIDRASETEALAASVPDTDGVYFVPAFNGLGTPYWNSDARGMICGLTRGATRAHLVRAALESIAYQNADVLRVMEAESGMKLQELRVDGGACANGFLMQFQADLLGAAVKRPVVQETTALGAAYLAGLGAGVWPDPEELQAQYEVDRVFEPDMEESRRKRLYDGWFQAVSYQTGNGT